MNFIDICWHDIVITSVNENPDKDELVYCVEYPEDWGKNIFIPKSIVFTDYHSHTVNEMPFSGNPTILSANQRKLEDGYNLMTLVTNAGTRTVSAKKVHMKSRDSY